MRKVILIPIIIGAVTLTAGAVIFSVGIARQVKYNQAKPALSIDVNETYHNFNIDVSTADLYFTPSTDGTTKVEVIELEKQTHEVTVNEDTLYIKYKDERKWYEKIFSFGRMKITISMPVASYSNLKIESDTGNINMPNDFTFDAANIELSTGDINFKAKVNNEIVFKSSTGDMRLDSVDAKSMDLSMSTGKCYLKDVNVTEKIKVNASTGDISLTNVTANDLESKSSTGKVTLTNSVITNHIAIKTSTGDIKFNDSDAATLKINSDTGDVRGTLLTEKIFYAHSHLGTVRVPTSTTGGLCEIDTDTGDIIITIKA